MTNSNNKILLCIAIVCLLLIVARSIYMNLNTLSNFKDVGPYLYAGFGNEGMYYMAQKRMAQGLDPMYAAPLQHSEMFAPVSLLEPNGVRPLET
jgi:hypothetical protein